MVALSFQIDIAPSPNMRNLVSAALVLIAIVPLSALAHPEELVQSLTDQAAGQSPPATQTGRDGRPLWQLDAAVPFVGSPVHEDMTKASVSLSRVHDRNFQTDKDDAYIHGVFWNDDPEDLLCPECSILNIRVIDKRWGTRFAQRFIAAKKRVRSEADDGPRLVFQVGDGLLERSHFGDLQFLHGMASRNGEPAGETQEKILAWAEFAYKVAIGDIAQKTKLGLIPQAQIRALFKGDPRLESMTIEQLFKGPRFARRAAIGSLLHMIQDSFAPGHAERKILDYPVSGKMVFARGDVVEFHCYTSQDEGLHGQDDKWPNGLQNDSPLGDRNPIAIGSRILQFMYANDGNGAPWTDVEKYLKEMVFAVTDRTTLAGPGDRYRKKP